MAREKTADDRFRDRMSSAIDKAFPGTSFEQGEVRYSAKRLVGALVRAGWTHARIERYISGLTGETDVTLP